MFGFHASRIKCDAGIFMFAGSFMTIVIVLATVGLLYYIH